MLKILAVDDMQQWRNYHTEALSVILKAVPYELILAESATSALEIINENIDSKFDLIISDLQMESTFEPEYAGEWLIRNIQNIKQYHLTPKIIVSAAYNVKFIAEQLNVHYLSKPSIIHNPLAYELKIREVLNC